MTLTLFKFIIYPSCKKALNNGRVKSQIFKKLSLNFTLVRAVVLYQTLLGQTPAKSYCSKFS